MANVKIPTEDTLGTLVWVDGHDDEQHRAYGLWSFFRVSMDNGLHARCDSRRILITDVDLKIIDFEIAPKEVVPLEPNMSHCPTCTCGKRAPVQQEYENVASGRKAKPAGTITWEEHLKAYEGYAARYPGQSAETLASRGGFGYYELVMFLGYEPKTWVPV